MIHSSSSSTSSSQSDTTQQSNRLLSPAPIAAFSVVESRRSSSSSSCSSSTALNCTGQLSTMPKPACSSGTPIPQDLYEMSSLLDVEAKQIMEKARNTLLDCYYSRLSRKEADHALCRSRDGTFLIRDCCSGDPGDFSLSMIHQATCYHFRICSVNHSNLVRSRESAAAAPHHHQEKPPPAKGPFFFVDGETQIFHGLDQLISYYASGAHGLPCSLTAVHRPSATDPTPTNSNQSSQNLLAPKLRQPEPIPLITRKFGPIDNLLHRASCQGDLRATKFVLECANRPCLIEKNTVGSTALHEAASLGHLDICQAILEAASMDVKENVDRCILEIDANGLTAVHRAAQSNEPMTLMLLLNLACLDGCSYVRNPYNFRVPLHEAAEASSVECVNILLNEFNAPAHPRTIDNRTPLDMARKNENLMRVHSNKSTIDAILNHRPDLRHVLPVTNWLHDSDSGAKTDRARSTVLLSRGKLPVSAKPIDGTFLIRRGSSTQQQQQTNLHQHSNLALSIWVDRSIFHYQISQTVGSKYYINDGPYFDSLSQLVNHYRCFSDGLPAQLAVAVDVDGVHRPLSSKRESPASVGEDQQLQIVENRNSPPQKSTRPNPTIATACTLRIIPLHDIQLVRSLGEGEFGYVWEAKLSVSTPVTYDESPCSIMNRRNGTELAELSLADEQAISAGNSRTPVQCHPVVGSFKLKKRRIGVAVKILKDMSEEGRREFLREAQIMEQLSHHCVVKIYGIVNEVSLMMVQELLPHGSLVDFVKSNKFQWKKSSSHTDFVTEARLRVWAMQIADGMNYMESKNFVHRDLAARNVLVASVYQVKVSDFGLSRHTVDSVYSQSSPSKIPIKWYAPEAIEYGRFTSKSDVWSYGVTLWEMFSLGKHPYGEFNGPEVLQFIKSNRRLSRPLACPLSTYRLMLCCWQEDEHKRPTFAEISQHFASDPEYQRAARASMPRNQHSVEKTNPFKTNIGFGVVREDDDDGGHEVNVELAKTDEVSEIVK